jgi:hypothetical protein
VASVTLEISKQRATEKRTKRVVDHKIASFGNDESPWNVGPDELKRQAIASLRGYIYQLHASVAAWIRLPPQGRLYLEIAEDYAEVLRNPANLEDILRAWQVKDTRESGNVTLNSQDVRDAIEHLFALQKSNPGRTVHLTFLTTSAIGQERDNPLPSGVAGLHAWKLAANGGAVAHLIAALKARFTAGPFADFLRASTDDEIQRSLISRLDFACGQPDWQEVERTSREYLVGIRSRVQATAIAASNAYDTLFAVVIEAVLQSATRELDAARFESEFARATAMAMPSQTHSDLLAALAAERRATDDVQAIDLSTLRRLSTALLELGRPPSILKHFPDADEPTVVALSELDHSPRWLVEEVVPGQKTPPAKSSIENLLSQHEHRHLIYAAPGAGKTHALWHLANTLLHPSPNSALAKNDASSHEKAAESDAVKVPLLLSVADLNSAEEALAPIQSVLRNHSPSKVANDPRVVVLLDGWTEFATGEYFAERSKLLAQLSDCRVIACARYSDVSDTTFRCWSLQLLTTDVVEATVSRAFPNSSRVSGQLADMIRLPLVLSLFLLLGGAASSPGELLSRFHRYVAKRLPEAFEDVLADAVSSLIRSGERNYSKLILSLKKSAARRNIPDPVELLQKLGTITERGRNALPVHDLYWSWLLGVGILREGRTEDAIYLLSTRESYELALQSNELPHQDLVASVASRDAVLAASFDASLAAPNVDPVLGDQLEDMFEHRALAVRCRAAIAGLRLGRSKYAKRALRVIDELSGARIHVPELQDALNPTTLFVHRAEVASWLGAPGTSIVMEVVAARGDEIWVPWLESVHRRGLLDSHTAVAVALACSGRVPKWCGDLLVDLLATEPWMLRFTSERRANVELAMWLANHYEEAAAPHTAGSGWWHVNQALLACGDDAVFERLLELFPSMGLKAQEFLGYAIASLGDPWLARFQRLAFAVAGAKHHHAMRDRISKQISEEIAREWIALGYHEHGWQTIIESRGSAVLPELIEQLPATFDGAVDVTALRVMRYLRNSPESLIQELDSRNRGQISAIDGESIILAAAQANTPGIEWLVQLATREPPVFGGYHAMLVLRAYVEWTKESGRQFLVNQPPVNGMPFAHWYVAARFLRDWNDIFSPEALALVPELALPVVVEMFKGDDDKAKRILERQPLLSSFDSKLFERMITSETLAPLIKRVFADVFVEFPLADLKRFVECSFVKQDEVEYALRFATSVEHKTVHCMLIERVLAAVTDIQRIRSIANMLRSYSRGEVVEILRELPRQDTLLFQDNLHWLCREVGNVRGELLVDEGGNLFACT